MNSILTNQLRITFFLSEKALQINYTQFYRFSRTYIHSPTHTLVPLLLTPKPQPPRTSAPNNNTVSLTSLPAAGSQWILKENEENARSGVRCLKHSATTRSIQNE